MGSHGIKDQVAIIGIGCTPFLEHWDKSLDDLIIDAAQSTYASAGIPQEDVDAFWFGTSQSAAITRSASPSSRSESKPRCIGCSVDRLNQRGLREWARMRHSSITDEEDGRLQRFRPVSGINRVSSHCGTT